SLPLRQPELSASPSLSSHARVLPLIIARREQQTARATNPRGAVAAVLPGMLRFQHTGMHVHHSKLDSPMSILGGAVPRKMGYSAGPACG
ncbi:MAG TPA: hypothetical protein VF493_07035, partial [Terriglobales bacterium]